MNSYNLNFKKSNKYINNHGFGSENSINSINGSNNKCECNSNCGGSSKTSCGGNCGGFCKCVNSFYNDEEGLVFFDDDSYAVYRLGNWENKYNINLMGIDNEIPATEITKNQSLKIMNEIRNYSFNYRGVEINGMLGLAIRYTDLNLEDIDKLIAIEKREYENIKKELANLKLENYKDFVELNNEKFLIYKLKENCHGAVMSRPANNFTREHSTVELSKIKLSSV